MVAISPPSAFSPRFFGFSAQPTKFRVHRLGGAFFLLSYALAWYALYRDFARFERWSLPLVPPALGCVQAISAACTFRFLPRNEDNGYFSDKGILSYNFVLENLFYQLCTFFGAVYYLHKDLVESYWIGQAGVLVFMFFPYTLLRPFFPTTRLSYTNSSDKSDRFRSKENKSFYNATSNLIKYFYIWAKHCMGIGFNYLFWLGVVTPADMRTWGWPLLLLNAGTVSIAVFLHTLRFKKIMSPRLAHMIYVGMAYASFLAVPPLLLSLVKKWEVLFITSVGIGVNMMRNKPLMHIHYVVAALLVYRMRFAGDSWGATWVLDNVTSCWAAGVGAGEGAGHMPSCLLASVSV